MDWDKLRVFYTVAKAGSFTKAGEHLNLSQSAISRQISGLEDSLNISLFHRHARGLILTEQGDILYHTVKDVFTALAKVEHSLTESKERPKGPLTVTAPITLGSYWLTPLMREFIELYPEISVNLLVDDREMDLSMREADVAIRLSPPTQPDLISRHLVTIHSALYASDDYLQHYGVPATAEALDGHRLIAYGEDARAPYKDVNWLLKEGARYHMQRRPIMKVNNLLAMRRAVESGLGIACIPNYLTHGRPGISKLLHGLKPPSIETYFAYPTELRHSKRLKVFRDFLIQKASESVF